MVTSHSCVDIPHPEGVICGCRDQPIAAQESDKADCFIVARNYGQWACHLQALNTLTDIARLRQYVCRVQGLWYEIGPFGKAGKITSMCMLGDWRVHGLPII